jgi:outer membrane protein assembly factor BamA
LKGKDVFTVTGESKKSIRLRIISGPGNDKIEERSLVHSGRKKTWIYEQSPKAEIELGEEGKIIKHWNQAVYNYDRTAFTYPTYLPSPYISYNQYNGLELSMGIEFTRQKFGKQDYSIRHNFRVSATTQGNFVFKYTSRFRHVIRKWDIELEGIYARPDNYNFFFGSGNQTIKDDARFDNEYYVTRFNRYGLGTSLIQDFWKRSNFSWKASYERYEGVIDENTILSGERSFFGIAPLHMLESEVKLDMDFRDNPALPGKGMRLWISHQNGIITNNNNSNYGITSAFVEHYATIHTKFPITLGLKAGAGDSYGSIPFYKQLSLGQLNDLRGYVRHRFTGDGKLFINSELRLQLLDVKTSVVPIKLGVKGFYDSGRVYVNKEYSSNWHKGYGGGMYIVPLDKRFTCSASVAFSKEETAFFLISLGKVF